MSSRRGRHPVACRGKRHAGIAGSGYNLVLWLSQMGHACGKVRLLMQLLAEMDQTLTHRLESELADVEARFAAELLSDLDCVNSLVSHIERFRGKMLRPTLVLVTAMACRPDQEQTSETHRVVATVVEMVHMATLVHDDILDEAQMRRRGATINQLCGNEAAVMLGDYLISHAYHLCSSLGRTDISREIAAATNVVCEGELLQLANRNNWQLDEGTYFEVIRRKTASLCGLCCRMSAALCEVGPELAQAMHNYGEVLGAAFQIVDDVLDLTGDPKTVGKTLGRDLEKGKLTLPLIHCLSQLDEPQREEMVELLNGQSQQRTAMAPRQCQMIRRMLESTDSLGYARRWAGCLVEQATISLTANLPDSPGRQMLIQMAKAVLTRRS